MLVVVSGLPGVGKSAVAAAVAARLGAVHLSIDSTEDALLGAGLPAGYGTGVAAYEAVRAAAEHNLMLGRTVVVDAVNDSEPARETWRRAAGAAAAGLVFVVLSLGDRGEHRRRLTGRVRDLAHVLEPSWDDVERRAANSDPWRGRDVLPVEAGGALDDVVERVVAVVTIA